MAKKRKEVALEDTWDLTSIYADQETWKKEFEKNQGDDGEPKWPELAQYKGRLGEGADILKKTLETMFQIDRQLSKLYVYANLKHHEDIADDANKVAQTQILNCIHAFAQEASWLEPELLELEDEVIQAYLNSPTLADYKFHIEKIVRIKKHLLSPEEEGLMALTGKPLQSTYKAFGALNDADFKFGTILDKEGKAHELTHGTYSLYLYGKDRTLRENAFLGLHRKFGEYENTLGELLNGTVQTHLFVARARKYNSCLEASLFPKNIDVSAYHSLIKAVHKRIGELHRYFDLRAKLLDIGPLHLYDMSVPLIPSVDIRLSYKEAESVVIDSVAPLGKEYQNQLRKGLEEDRWVDRYENQNKRSGAYSSGCYDSHPYILMNFKELMRDVFTLAHEAGHSMHTQLSKKQPYHYADYPIFVAEVASTFNEELLMREFLARAKSREEKAFLINQKIDDIRATLFRQTMFAEFELWMHEQAEKNVPLTPKTLKEKYRSLNAFYFGDSVILDSESDIEWARIPHFYYDFYVYQYATGISAALSLAKRVTEGGDQEREAYLNFLKGGSSDYPLELLKMAGVDMRSPAPVEAAIDRFSSLVTELESLTVGTTV